MTMHWKAVEQYFTAVLFVFQFVCNFGKSINFKRGTDCEVIRNHCQILNLFLMGREYER